MPLPPSPPPRVTQGRQVARWGAPPPPQQKGGGARGPPKGPAPARRAVAPERGRGGTTSACRAPHAWVRGGATCVIRAPGTERRIQGMVSVDREAPCRAPSRSLWPGHLRLPLRLRLLGGLGLGLLAVALARPVAVQPALEAGPRGPRLCGLRGVLAGRELAFLDPKSRPQGGPRAVGQRSCHLRLTVTLLRCLGSQKDDKCLHQLALPFVVQLHIRNALRLAQG